MPLTVSPLQGLYTRQQIADKVGIASDLLAYWIKEGLLLAAEGEGLGKGKHRLFGFEAIHVAAVLKELGHNGLQTAGLKQIASLLWRVAAFGWESSDETKRMALDAVALRNARARYRARSPLAAGEAQGTVDEGDLAVELAFALHHELFTEAIFERLDGRWMFIHSDDGLLAVPEDFARGMVNLDRIRSYLVINLSLIIRPIWML